MPGSLCAYLQHLYPSHPPTIVIVEPRGADCCWRSAQAGDGDMRSVMVMVVMMMMEIMIMIISC